jgi:membrane-anchored protein YejM (alkaline phosphatase superfamily)
MGQGLARVAQAVAPYAVDAAANFLGGAFGASGGGGLQGQNNTIPNYTTAQADQALRDNSGFVNQQANQQAALDEQRRRQQVAYNSGLNQNNALFEGQVLNSAANAGTARNMAANAQSTLNNVYQNAAQNVNSAANNTMNALNESARFLSGAFGASGGGSFR